MGYERTLHGEAFPIPTKPWPGNAARGKGVHAPDLATVEDFVHFHAASSNGKIVELPTADLVNAFAEWFFAGFTRATGTPTIDEDRSEVCDLSY